MKHVFSGNAIAEAATAVATNEMDSAAIIKTGDEFQVMPDADTESAFVYAASVIRVYRSGEFGCIIQKM